MKFASANFYHNISLKAKYITRTKCEYHLRSKYHFAGGEISLRPTGVSGAWRFRTTSKAEAQDLGF